MEYKQYLYYEVGSNFPGFGGKIGNMVNDGKKGRLYESSEKNLSLYHSQVVHNHRSTEGERSLVEAESEMYRNNSEELFLKSLMETSIGLPVPTMEMLGFKNLSQGFRTDSEELFKSWLTNGENHGHSPSSIAHRTRQASRRTSTELANLSSHEHGGLLEKKKSNDILFAQNTVMADEIAGDLRNVVERGMQASNLYLAKAWFHSSQPMTRSRSSELRRRYAAMQTAQTTIGLEAMHNASALGANKLKEEFENPNGFTELPMSEIPDQMRTFMSPSNSSSSTFNTPQTGNIDNVSSVVSMLKGTLERKKLSNQIEKETFEEFSNGLYRAQEFSNGHGNHIHEMQGTLQELSAGQVKDPGVLQMIQGSFDLDLEGFVNPTNTNQMSTFSREPSQSESSAAAPVVSSGFDTCDGPSNSSQTVSICESSRRQVGNGKSSENGSRAKDFRERIIDNLKDDRKREGLVRYGSVTSAGSAEKGDPTKKRRVERSRKMAEAKERNLTPPIPSDMQSVLKRCENLEKEVRSLKLNLSFMNRKDSEQTKQIEELQKQNEDLTDEKERLLEEIERIIAETGKM
ncbi:protein CYCLOPS [Citrus sinensis]|uniref:protein CYCLOPS-like isoform X2 n=1 Tax=Citrus sinensis TaxID=2711 RepID=UPI00219C9654|nr:protein CYCLOPS-like isoform X2 [Citrus sinensis]KAH9687718.1 protein CYCLOPS [Citrus sinensis]